jgi:UPF0271 protein
LVPRSKEGAVIQDEHAAVRRTIQMVKKGIVVAVDGTEIPIHADSVCLHGDGEKAVLFAKMLFENLTEEGIEIVPLEKVVE